jgi:amino acid adenylation domain-containing protein
MVEDSGPVVLLLERGKEELFSGMDGRLRMIELCGENPVWGGEEESNPARAAGLSAESLAYVIYTSGSTGRPKGVMNRHQGLVNRLVWMQSEYELNVDDAVLQKTPFSFDVSVWEFFWPLLVGARLVMARPEGHKDPAYLVRAIQRNNITTMHFVPSMLEAFLEHANGAECASVLRVMCSGEALSSATVRRFQERLSNCALHNLYGPTEAAIDVTSWTCARDIQEERIAIGRPIGNTRIYILDEEGEPVPVGVGGEIHIGGDGVGRGYLRRPELTAERFVADPFSGEEGARMYRTGDVGRWRGDGNIEFLGRNDEQVKIRGFRIELGEIEARLSEHEGVQEAVVLAREDMPGDKRLVAYYTSSPAADTEQEGVGAEQLRAHLAAKLPEYMVPAAYVRMERMPLTANGKLDRKSLPAPGVEAYGMKGYEEPQGETERVLAAIWSELLKVERVGREDNFFELGGHSLLAVKLMQQIQTRLGVKISLLEVFTSPRLCLLAERIVIAELAQFDQTDLARILTKMKDTQSM